MSGTGSGPGANGSGGGSAGSSGRRSGGGGAGGSRRRQRNTMQDPLGLDGELFQYVAHRQDHGEAFVCYRLLGRPIVLHSLEDGLPLASLHLRVASRRGDRGQGPPAQALIARRPDRGDSEFLGIITADGQEFELVMTNLTANDVLMFDIGGETRVREEQHWERTDASFWSERHRNDRRLNRSNILWPMIPNVCSENHLYFQDRGEHRQLVLRARASGGERSPATRQSFAEEDVANALGFPLHVYPKFGTRTAERFARTSWSCPETILVIGTPSLLEGDFREGHNIQEERPRAPPTLATSEPQDEAAQAAATLGVPRERLLRVLGLDEGFLRDLPAETQRQLLVVAFQSADLSALEDEPPPESARATSSSAAAADATDQLALGARPADVSAGRRLLGAGQPHSLLIEKFDFPRHSADAILSLGVRDSIQLVDSEDVQMEPEEEAVLVKRLDQLVATRTAELIEDSRSKTVFSTPECVVCMESSPPPDIVLYQCGHRCVHLKCVESVGMRRCPLCRSPIVALLPHSGDSDTRSRREIEGL